MIEINHGKEKCLIILNNRVFKSLADLGLADIIASQDLNKLDDPDFVEKLAWMGYVEGCKYSETTPMKDVKFKVGLTREAALEIENLFIEQLLEIGEYVTSKKKLKE